MNAKTPWTISVATYNILADEYIRPEYYPSHDPSMFVSRDRHPRLADRVAGLGADVTCLQEVNHALFDLIDGRLEPLGYIGRCARRNSGKLDGCATFVRPPWKPLKSAMLLLANRVALVTLVEQGGCRLSIVNTHLQWHPPDAPTDERAGLLQARQLLMHLQGQRHVIICGDFNAEPGSDVLEAFRAAGFSDAHDSSIATFNSAGTPRKIDYLLHSSGFAATPSTPPPLSADTLLPSNTEPSDHLPLVASFVLTNP